MTDKTESRGERALRLLQEMEWSASATGQPTGMGLDNGTVYPEVRCPECGGLNPAEMDQTIGGEFIEEAFGHRSGCVLADILGRPTVVREGESGSLPL